jgi:hypothetical protein
VFSFQLRSEIFHGADYDCVVQLIRAVIGCFAVQRPDELLLPGAQDALRQAAEIPESPQKMNSVPAGSGGVDHALTGIECDENPLREQEKLRGGSECSRFSTQFGCQTRGEVTGYHERRCRGVGLPGSG